MDNRILRQLGAIDWDFVQGDQTQAAPLHWYPGTFVPALPGALIEAMTVPGEAVFDPYCGAGTTGVAALVRGRRAMLTDVNPVGVLSSYCTLALISLKQWSPTLFGRTIQAVEATVGVTHGDRSLDLTDASLEHDLASALSRITSVNAAGLINELKIRPPNLEPLRIWFEAETLFHIQRTLAALQSRHGATFPYVLGVAMVSANARRLSSQTRSWGHLADNVRPPMMERKDTRTALSGWLRRLTSRLGKVEDIGAPLEQAFSVHRHNWATQEAEPELPQSSALVTSPPYAGAIDYALSQRLSLYLFGYDDGEISALMSTEIGARRKRGAPGHVGRWADHIAEAAVRQSRYVGRGPMAFVLPHKDAGREVGEVALEAALTVEGWSVAFRADRSIRQARTRQSWTSIKQETVVIFEKN